MRSNKVVICLPPTCGGAERVSLTIGKILVAHHYKVEVLIVGREEGDIKDFIPNEIKWTFVHIRNIWEFTTLKLAKIFLSKKPDIVFCSLMYLNPRVILAAKISRIPHIIVRNNNSIETLDVLSKMLVKKTYPLADKVIFQTLEMKAEFTNKLPFLPKEKTFVITNPVDTYYIDEKIKGNASPYDEQYVNYVFVGRIHPSKGLDVLIPAFHNLLSKINNSRLYIVGKADNDEYANYLRDLANKLNLKGNIFWVGFTDNPYRYMAGASCLVLPSRLEGLPNVVLEAIYLGVPVIATRSVPVVDRIVGKKQGIVVDVGDEMGLMDAMCNITRYRPERGGIRTDNQILDVFRYPHRHPHRLQM